MSFISYSLPFIFHAQFSTSMPLSSLDEKPTEIKKGWQSNPTTRGTLSLLFSCSTTLVLCVYTCLHLNVPRPRHSRFKRLLTYFEWSLIGFFAPEVVVFLAFKQYSSAKALQQLIAGNLAGMMVKDRKTLSKRLKKNKKGGISVESQSANGNAARKDEYGDNSLHSLSSKNTWTMTHSFYASMGGFVLHMGQSCGFLPPQHSRLTLTAKGVKFFHDCGQLPFISEDEILDKSKSDTLAKIIVCVQAGWLILQVVGRVAAKLPVTLLEINTFGHVVCAFAIYVLWWNKPQTINEPTIIEGPWVKQLCAFLYMGSSLSNIVLKKEEWSRRYSNEYISPSSISSRLPVNGATELGTLFYITPGSPEEIIELGAEDEQQEISTDVLSKPERFTRSLFKYRQLERHNKKSILEQVEPIEDYSPEARFVAIQQLNDKIHDQEGRAATETLAEDCQEMRHRLALQAIHKFSTVKSQLRDRRDVTYSLAQVNVLEDQQQLYEYSSEDIFIDIFAQNWGAQGFMEATQSWATLQTFLLYAGVPFGALHLLAWNNYFPSNAERWLWRSSALVMTVSSIMVNVIYLIVAKKGPRTLNNLLFFMEKNPFSLSNLKRRHIINDSSKDHDAGAKGRVLVANIKSVVGFLAFIVHDIIVSTVLLPVYVFVRVFLAIEAFISIRELPIAAYRTPQWAEIIPHF